MPFQRLLLHSSYMKLGDTDPIPRAGGPVVMMPPLRGGDRGFDSHPAHLISAAIPHLRAYAARMRTSFITYRIGCCRQTRKRVSIGNISKHTNSPTSKVHRDLYGCGHFSVFSLMKHLFASSIWSIVNMRCWII